MGSFGGVYALLLVFRFEVSVRWSVRALRSTPCEVGLN